MEKIEEKELETKYDKSARKQIDKEKKKILEPETTFGVNWL
jgi:vacuolar-type H+-ATPase subunit H